MAKWLETHRNERETGAFMVESVAFMLRMRSRVLDLETSLARRGAVGGRQRLGETLEDSVQQQLEQKDEEVKTMREASHIDLRGAAYGFMK